MSLLIVSIMCTGNANRSRLIRNGARDRLPNPPGRVRRELVAPPVLELVDGLHQADVALLDQIQELQTAVRVLLRDGDDEPQVGLDQFLLGLLGLRFAFENRSQRARELLDGLFELLRHAPDFLAELLPVLEENLLLFLAQLLLRPFGSSR